MTIKEQLKKIREEKGLSRKDVAEKACIPYTTYVKYETGEREPVLSSLIKLADFYQISLDYLVGRAPQTDAMKLLIAQTDITPDALADMYEGLPPEAQAIMMTVMRMLKENRAKLNQKQIKTIILKCFQDAASAGSGEVLCSSDADDVTVIATPEAQEAEFLVRVSGDSMEPTFHGGDLLLCKSVAELEDGEIGVFRHEGTGYVKEYRKAGLFSHNPAYDMIPKSKLAGMEISGKVLGIAQLPEKSYE